MVEASWKSIVRLFNTLKQRFPGVCIFARFQNLFPGCPNACTLRLQIIFPKEFERVGGSQIIKSDGRILATTNKTLEKAVEILERDRIVDSLKMMRGNMAKSANTLGITERQIAYKAKKGGVARRLQYSDCYRL